MIDLHCHSNHSDGMLSPFVLLEKALAANIQMLALTDHDTVLGLHLLHAAAANKPIQIINGIELSVRWKKYDLHILGLNIIPNAPSLQDIIAKQRASRVERAEKIAIKLKACGVNEAYDKAFRLSGHERVGRPHFAQVLVDEGFVPDVQTAFKRYLGRGKLAYVPTSWISTQDAVAAIVGAQGVAVIAHPLKYKLTQLKLRELIYEFKTAGGKGIEVISGETNIKQIEEMAGLCARYELFASTGSDYHGDALSTISLGRQKQLPLNCLPIWQLWS